MLRIVRILLPIAVSFFLFSCKENTGNESMALHELQNHRETQLNYLNSAIQDDPDNDKLLAMRAAVYLQLFRSREALGDIQAAINENPSLPSYYLLLAQIQFSLKNYFETIKATEKAESLGCDDPELPIVQAKVYWETGDTARYSVYLSRVESVTPFHSDVTMLKGKKAASKGDTSNAITYFVSSIKNDRRNYESYTNLIAIYLNKQKYDSALTYIMKAKEIYAKHPYFYYAEGVVFLKNNLKTSALTAFISSYNQDSINTATLYQLANYYEREGNVSEAIRYYQKYLGLQKDNSTAYRTMIALLTSQEKLQTTIPYYERLIQLDSTNTGLKYTLDKLYKQFAVAVPTNTPADTAVYKPTSVPTPTARVRRDSIRPTADTARARIIRTVPKDTVSGQ